MDSKLKFNNLYRHGFVRAAAISIPIALADPAKNAATIIEQLGALDKSVALAVFPELCVTGASLGDLFHSEALLRATKSALQEIADASRCLTIVGAPVAAQGQLFNCAVAVQDGEILGLVPKLRLTAAEARVFTSGVNNSGADELATMSDTLCFTSDEYGVRIMVEVGADALAPAPRHAIAFSNGVTIVANPFAEPATIGSTRRRLDALKATAAASNIAVIAAGTGAGESSTESAWLGGATIVESDEVLADTKGVGRVISDIHVSRLTAKQRRDPHTPNDFDYVEEVEFEITPPRGRLPLIRQIPRFPFVPDDVAAASADVYKIQTAALVQRLSSIGNPKIVLGVSGGLDSTQALVTAVKTMDQLGRPRTDILAYTMPGFATSGDSKDRATRLAACLGVTFVALDIRESAQLMLDNLGHDGQYDITFENVQAGLRTDYLFRIANHRGGIVLGTGDLSESALGWCTYGVGDHMSHFNVNAGLPKTMMQYALRWVITAGTLPDEASTIIREILEAEISPELVPGEVTQSTQGTIGPYPLQDFNLYYCAGLGLEPTAVAFLAAQAWGDAAKDWPELTPEAEKVAYDLATIKSWLAVFVKRFYSLSQFKRSAAPNGPALYDVSLSPRSGWVAPSDCGAQVWLDAINQIPDA